jgi:hypothetical protein
MGLDYSHRPLAEELDAGARQLELDVVRDPQGGRFAVSLKTVVRARAVVADPRPGQDGHGASPGYKVLHMQDVDFRTTCPTFVACLTEIRAWSKAHPGPRPDPDPAERQGGAVQLPRRRRGRCPSTRRPSTRSTPRSARCSPTPS